MCTPQCIITSTSNRGILVTGLPATCLKCFRCQPKNDKRQCYRGNETGYQKTYHVFIKNTKTIDRKMKNLLPLYSLLNRHLEKVLISISMVFEFKRYSERLVTAGRSGVRVVLNGKNRT